jgi:putative oxidoreductase
MHATLVTIGRIMLGLFFVVLGLAKAKGVMDSGGLGALAGYIGSRGLPQPQVLAAATIAFEIIGGLALVFGYFTTPVAFLMAGFCIATAALFHNFWTFPADQLLPQFQNFMKNIGLAGAYLVLAGDGIRSKI